MTAVLPEPTATDPSAGRHRAPADATTGSMGPIPADRRSRSAHGAHQRPTAAPLQRAARTGALSLAAIGALAGAGGIATHSLADHEPAATGEQALPAHLAAADMTLHSAAAPVVSAPAVMPVAAMGSSSKPAIKTGSPDSRAAAGKAAASAAKASADRKAAADRQAAASSVGARAVALAKSQIGVPYEWGGTTPSGFDCSGLMQWAYGKLGKDLPRTSSAQATEGQKVSTSDLQPGDLIFMYSPVSHVAMYAGNGQVIEAPTEGEDVKMTPLSHYKSEMVGARRL